MGRLKSFILILFIICFSFSKLFSAYSIKPEITEGYNVSFTVKSGSLFIENAKVELGTYGALFTNENGRVTFEDVDPGNFIKYTISATAYDTILDSLNVVNQDVEKIVSLTKTTYVVTFKVKANGEILPGAGVSLEGYGTKQTNEQGEVKFEGVLPAENIVYEVTAESFALQEGTLTVVDEDVYKIIDLVEGKFKVTFWVRKGNEAIKNAKVVFSDYGTQYTDTSGKAYFEGVAPGVGLAYTIKISGFSDYISALNVFNTDVVEEITYPGASYNVLFVVLAHGDPLSGAQVSLAGYGMQNTDNSGYARFINVDQEDNIAYTVSANGYPDVNGSISVIDKDITETVSVTHKNELTKRPINFWPNPANEKLIISSEFNGIIRIFNLNGKLLKSSICEDNLTQIELNGIKPGVYLINFSGKDFNWVQKVIVE